MQPQGYISSFMSMAWSATNVGFKNGLVMWLVPIHVAEQMAICEKLLCE